MPRFRPRISLLNALLLVTITGMSIVIIELWREVGPLRTEVRRLRDEVGVLSVDDPAKIHAIQVPTNDELTWKWRVWIPENRAYVIRSYGDQVPKDGYPKGGGTMRLDAPGENVILYRISRDPRNGQWFGTLEANSGSVGSDNQPWIEWRQRTSTSSGVGKATQSFEPDQRLELIRKQVSQASDSSKIEDPAAGFMIWLEPTN